LETQQAHSHARDVTRQQQRPAPSSIHSIVWLNLVCLDAPLVAVSWLWLFARTFSVPFQRGNAVALFLTAWLIYLADRLADSLFLKPTTARSLRQEFCLHHREIWIATVALVAGFDAYFIWRSTAPETFLIGAVVGGLATIYLVLNHPFGLIWRSLPAKELAIGFLFAAGTLVALLPRLPALTPAFVAGAFSFAALCSLNCISIARWERELDRAQGKVSIATRHPRVAQRAGEICVFLALCSFAAAIAFPSARPILVCAGLSALLLGWLNFGGLQSNDQRSALADLVLLTPIVAIALMAL
jgi:hypothetical protein